MKTTRFWISLGVTIIIFIAILAYTIIPRSDALAKSKSVVGSWNVVVTVVNQNAIFPGFMTFFNDGNLIADEVPSPLETSGHGSWISSGPNRGAYTFVFLIGSTEPGKWMKGTVSGTLKYNPKADQWDGPFTILVVDQDGNEVLSDTGTMSGTRITVED